MQPQNVQVINPYCRFIGSFVPNAIQRRPRIIPFKVKEDPDRPPPPPQDPRRISNGAVAAYGRLMQFAGKAGRAWPSMATLGAELGVTARTARRYVEELERGNLIRREIRQGKSNRYHFLEHKVLAVGERVLRTDVSAKEVHTALKPGEETMTSNSCELQTVAPTPPLPQPELEPIRTALSAAISKDGVQRRAREDVVLEAFIAAEHNVQTAIDGIWMAVSRGWHSGGRGRKRVASEWFYLPCIRERVVRQRAIHVGAFPESEFSAPVREPKRPVRMFEAVAA